LLAAAIVGGAAMLSSLLAGQNPPPVPGAAKLPPPALPAAPSLVVVIDPAHGGGDTGARGATGTLEKEVVLVFARVLRTELQRQGLQVVLTRESDADRLLDDRAAVGNAPRHGIFISLHVASLGPVGAARAYFFPAPSEQAESVARTARLVPWERAQEPFAAQSRKLAELVQVQLGQKLRGSLEVPAAAAVRQLRIVAAPAIAVEVSNIAAERKALEQRAAALAEAIARGVTSFLPMYREGAR
jgi:N-acetylmuramoyl-L-alanine amidase